MASWCQRCEHITAMPTDDCGGSEDFPWEMCPLSTGKELSQECLEQIQAKHHADCDPPDPLTAPPLPPEWGPTDMLEPFSASQSPSNGAHTVGASGESIYLIIVVILIVLIFNLFVCLAAYFYCCTNIFRRKKHGLAHYDHMKEPVMIEEILGGASEDRISYYFGEDSHNSWGRRYHSSRRHPSQFTPNFQNPSYSSAPPAEHPPTYNSVSRGNSRSSPPPIQSRSPMANYDVLFDGRKLEHNRDRYMNIPRSQSERNFSRSHSARRHAAYTTTGLHRSKSNPALHRLSPVAPLRERLKHSSFSKRIDDTDDSHETGVSFNAYSARTASGRRPAEAGWV